MTDPALQADGNAGSSAWCAAFLRHHKIDDATSRRRSHGWLNPGHVLQIQGSASSDTQLDVRPDTRTINITRGDKQKAVRSFTTKILTWDLRCGDVRSSEGSKGSEGARGAASAHENATDAGAATADANADANTKKASNTSIHASVSLGTDADATTATATETHLCFFFPSWGSLFARLYGYRPHDTRVLLLARAVARRQHYRHATGQDLALMQMQAAIQDDATAIDAGLRQACSGGLFRASAWGAGAGLAVGGTAALGSFLRTRRELIYGHGYSDAKLRDHVVRNVKSLRPWGVAAGVLAVMMASGYRRVRREVETMLCATYQDEASLLVQPQPENERLFTFTAKLSKDKPASEYDVGYPVFVVSVMDN